MKSKTAIISSILIILTVSCLSLLFPAQAKETLYVLWAATGTFTNKTISGTNNTLTNIPNGSLTNQSVTIAGKPVSLGGTITLASSNLSDYGSIPNAALANRSVILNGTTVPLGGTATITATAGNTLGLTSGAYPSAGYVGEIMDTGAVVTTLTSSTGAGTTITSLTLTAGNWVCSGSVIFNGTAITTYLSGGGWYAGISSGSSPTTSLDTNAFYMPVATTTDLNMTVPTPNYFVSLQTGTTNKTRNLIALAHFSAGTVTVTGRMVCRRFS